MSTYGKGSEDAVSPVIGVILMVAITVILAAVIAAFVFGMAGNVNKTKNIAITASKGQNYLITLTNMGGQDAATVGTFTVSATNATGSSIGTLSGSLSSQVGSVGYIQGDSQKDRVIVTATFVDGTQQVVLDTTV